ncbi:MAG: glycosyltransferase family 2 protein [Kaiparowitsia implicata GSE-PSE-MK54-09C]|jgi:glycosyltransferase involved in cell wall biosynthesis|nr:glycosyltransferase family 2 protein [Kaiparowitsia implicata GSE-PSE-MK54-09C]
MTKLIIQIPCYNEEKTLGITLSELPRQVPGIDVVEWLVIDDGSGDRTLDIAKSYGVDHILRFPTNQGLARGFMAGIEEALSAGADIIVNTDADNQYCAADIPKLVQPILRQQADMVIGARPIWQTSHFSTAKKLLQKVGSWVVRLASDTNIVDAPSGFRAFSREAALQFNVFSSYTYTLETVIQAGRRGMTVVSVPIRTNPQLRRSRLVRSIPSYVFRSGVTILRIFMLYKPMRFFLTLGTVPFSLGALLSLRWLYLFLFIDSTRSRAPSLILAAVMVLIGFQLWMFGLIADLLAANRRILEETQLRQRRRDLDAQQIKPEPPS